MHSALIVEDHKHRTDTLLIRLMDSGSRDKRSEILDVFFGELANAHADSQANTREAYLLLLNAFTYLARMNGKRLEDLVGTASLRAERNVLHSAKLLKSWSLIVLGALFDKEPLTFDENHRQLIKKAHGYIELHLNTNVTLQSIGDSVYLNGLFLSRIYKEMTGENLSDYIVRARMEKAKQLLEQTSMRIYEITEQVGYRSTQPFIRRFKQYYGVTPEFYRKRQGSGRQ